MLSNKELALTRRIFAAQITFLGDVEDPRLEDAYATVRREDFVGPGPWPICLWSGYRTTPSADPLYLYSDVLVGLVPERGLNNGQPSSHATWLARVDIREGDHVVHVGAGMGYYSAIMASLVGPSGRVTAIEFDPELAKRARNNFRDWPNVRVMEGDGSLVDFEPADVIYVNAGATRPADKWLDGLKDGGRLLLPLTTDGNFEANSLEAALPQGAVFWIQRRGDELHAEWVSQVAVFPCTGMRDPGSERALAQALKTKRWTEVTRLYRSGDLQADRCWLRAPGWSLAYS
jgi:protein-L-isoaspartate(D-aspartate) O-methyltransferase